MPRSKLEKAVRQKLMICLNGVTILENTRPDWLISSQGERLELDFYIPELDLAIEVQGQQHYTFVPHFHLDQNGFVEQLCRNREKRYLCECKGITLLEIASDAQLNDLTTKIVAMIPKAETGQEFVARMKKYNEAHPERINPTRKKKWRHGIQIKAHHFPKCRIKLLHIVKTIRVLDKNILTIHKELSFTGMDNKQRQLANLVKSRDEHVYGLKRFVGNWSKEIKMAFIIHRSR